MTSVMQEDEEPTLLGELLFPNFRERWFKVLERVKDAEQGGGLLSEDFFRKTAEEFYPDHVQKFIEIWMAHRIDYFFNPDPQEKARVRKHVWCELEKIGIYTWW